MLEARKLDFGFAGQTPLLREVSLSLRPGEWRGLSGHSGAGKSTLGKLLAGHLAPQHGSIWVDQRPLTRSGICPVQWLPQSPELAVNPRWRVGQILREAWSPPQALMDAFGIRAEWLGRYPHQLSGGELQRVCVLRALAPGVRYLVADEVSTMLDPLTQVELWQALKAHAYKQDLGVLVISHDAALLARLSRQCEHLENGRLTAYQALPAQGRVDA